jgi:hypothetical protein
MLLSFELSFFVTGSLFDTSRFTDPVSKRTAVDDGVVAVIFIP